MSRDRLIVASLLAIAIALLAAPSPRAQTGAVTSFSVQQTLRSAREWTAAEMLAAREYPLPELAGRPRHAGGASVPSEPEGLIPGVASDATPALPLRPASSPANQFVSEAYAYPPPYSTFVDRDYKQYPERTVGVLFFTEGKTGYQCSAAVIGRHAVWTAGHCVHSGNNDPGGWFTNFVFVPGYRAGEAPYGQWVGAYAWATPEWYANGVPDGLPHDSGGVVLRTDVRGRAIGTLTGWLGFAWNRPYIQHWMQLGYPAEPPYKGRLLQVCASSYAYQDDSFGSPNPMGVGCNQTAGASGGPWLMRFAPGRRGAANLLNSNISYRYTAEPEALYGPYFGSGAKSLRDCLFYSTPDTATCTP